MNMVWRHESSCVLDIVFDYVLAWVVTCSGYLLILQVVCCLSPIKYYSWFYTIIQCILVNILGWPIILIEYILPRTEPYLYSSLFSLYWVQQVYRRIWIAINSIKFRHIRFNGELFIRAWVGFSHSLSNVLSFRTRITLFHLFWCLWYS